MSEPISRIDIASSRRARCSSSSSRSARRRGVTIVGLARHRAGADGVEVCGRVRTHARGARRALAEELREDLDVGHLRPEAPARGRLPDHHARRVDVGAAIDLGPQRLLRRHVRDAPLEDAGLRLQRRVGRLRDAEVEDLRLPVEGDEDVQRAHVAVDDLERLAVEVAELVRVVQAEQRLADDRAGARPRGSGPSSREAAARSRWSERPSRYSITMK